MNPDEMYKSRACSFIQREGLSAEHFIELIGKRVRDCEARERSFRSQGDLKEAETASSCAAIRPLPAIGIARRHTRLVWIVFPGQRRKRFGNIRSGREKARGVGTNPACRIRPQPS